MHCIASRRYTASLPKFPIFHFLLVCITSSHRRECRSHVYYCFFIIIYRTDDDLNKDKDGEKDDEVYDFREPFLFSDMVLLVEDEKLHCHRAILSLYSPVFKAMFQSRFEVSPILSSSLLSNPRIFNPLKSYFKPLSYWSF